MKVPSFFRGKAQLAFALAILTLLAVSALSYHGMQVSVEAEGMVRHTHEVLESIQDLRFAWQSISSGSRGYALTGNDFYLQSYTTGLATVNRDLGNLHDLTADNPVQQRIIPTLAALVAVKIRNAEALVAMRTSRGLDPAAATIQSASDEQITKAFIVGVAGMQREELRLLALRESVSRLELSRTKQSLLFGAVLGLCIAGIASWIARRDSALQERAGVALREGEARFRNLANNMSPLAWIMDQNGAFLWYNQRWYEYFGTTDEEMALPDWEASVHHPDHYLRVIQEFSRCFATGEIWEDTFPLLGRDGLYHWFLSRAVPIRDADGKVVSWFGTNTDVTELEASRTHLAHTEARYRGLLEAAPDAMIVVDQHGEIVLLNVQAEKQFGYPRDELLGQRVKNIIPEGFSERLVADETRTATEALEQRIDTGIELNGRRKDGSLFPIEIMLSPLKSADGVLITAAIRNITVRKQAEEHLEHTEARYRGLLEAAPDAMVVVDQRGKIALLNVQAEKQFGYSRDELLEQEVKDIIPEGFAERLITDSQRSAEDALAQQIGTGIELVGRRKNGSEFPIEIMLSPLKNADGVLVTAAIRDITLRRKAEEELVLKVEELHVSNEELVQFADTARAMTEQMTHSAEHDFLTGLPNRLLLSDRIGQAIGQAQRHRNLAAVLFLDLDGFKHINDSLGHAIGDRLLQSVAARISDCVRSPDTISRQGGDEFIILVSEMGKPDDAAIVCRRLLQAVAGAHSIDHHDLHITACIGISVFPEDGEDAETLIKNADTAMYQAKENGPHTFQFFHSDMNARAVERQSIEEHLRRALERHEFSLHYQPKVNLSTGRITGAEALLRWTHPTRGSVSPAQFIPVAEDCGLILPIGAWVLREACTQAKAWSDAGLPALSMAVNVSAMQFQNESFLEATLNLLRETGLDPKYLELELTESALMKHPEATTSILTALRAHGVTVAVDDFGTGYSSLSYLRKFPLDSLKIDQSFVRQITTGPDATAIVRAIISMGRSLNLCIIAEGVETEAELNFLKAHWCDEAQGYLFSRPVPASQFAELFSTSQNAEGPHYGEPSPLQISSKGPLSA